MPGRRGMAPDTEKCRQRLRECKSEQKARTGGPIPGGGSKLPDMDEYRSEMKEPGTKPGSLCRRERGISPSAVEA